MNNDDAEKCMAAFKDICEEADRSTLIDSDECAYWVFERGYQAAMQAVAIKNKLMNVHKTIDAVSDMLANGFALLEVSGKTKKPTGRVN